MSDHRREQALALLGLHVSEPGRQPHGARPDDEELALLIEGELDAARREEVLSHVAADHALYRQLVTLAELRAPAAGAPAAAKRESWLDAIAARLRDWRIAMATGALGSATAAAVIAAVLVWQSVSTPPPGGAVELVAQPAQRQQELAARADRTALPQVAETAARCERLPHPDDDRRSGNLCVLSLPATDDDGIDSVSVRHWLWIDEGSARAWLQHRSGERPLALRASDDGTWIALHGREGNRASLQIHAVAALARGRFEPVIELDLGNAGMGALQWRGQQLEFVSRRDFTGDPDSPRDLDMPVRQRIDPDSGRIERAP